MSINENDEVKNNENQTDNTPKQDSAKKRANKMNILCLVGILLCFVGACLAIGGLAGGIFALIIVGIILIIPGAILYFYWRLYSRSHCKNCAKSLYGCEYSYELVRVQEAKSESEEDTYTFQVIAICPHCDATNEYKMDVKAKTDMDAKWKITQKMDTYFRTKRK